MAEGTAAGMAVEAPALMAASTALRMKGCCVVLPMGDCRIPCTAMYRQSGKCASVRIFRRAQAARPANSVAQSCDSSSRISRLVHDLVLIVIHDCPLVLLLIQLQLLVSIPSPQPKLSLILIYRNHWQNANRVSAHSESSHNPYTHVCKRSHAALPVALFTPLSFRRSLPPVNAVRQLLPCWFASQARPSYLSARWILPTIPARDAPPFLLIAHCPPTPCSYMPRSFTPLPSPGFFGTAPYLCCAARPTYVPTLPSLPELRP